MATDPTPEFTDEQILDTVTFVAALLVFHRDQLLRDPPTVTCGCGQWSMPFDHLGITEVAAEHRRHVGQVIVARLEREVRAKVAAAIRAGVAGQVAEPHAGHPLMVGAEMAARIAEGSTDG